MEYIEKERPKVVYIAFDATDDYAHEGKYDRYLMAANRQDQFLSELWKWLQSHPFYRKKTSIIILSLVYLLYLNCIILLIFILSLKL